MHPMSSSLMIVTSLVFIGVNSELLELRPELGRHQNSRTCLALNATFHIAFRSYELDPYLGGNAKCIRVTQTTPLENNSTEAILNYGTDGNMVITMTLESSPGYNYNNLVRVAPKGRPDLGVEFRDAYSNCGKCKIIRHHYIDGTPCSVLVPATEVDNLSPECHFIYELLCGTKKYPIYDDTCKSTH